MGSRIQGEDVRVRFTSHELVGHSGLATSVAHFQQLLEESKFTHIVKQASMFGKQNDEGKIDEPVMVIEAGL